MTLTSWTASTAAKPAAAALSGAEKFRLVQGGSSVSLTVATLAAHMLATLAFDPAGSASAAQAAAIASAASSLATHEAAGNPHAQYLTQAEGDAAYDALGAASTVQGLAAAALAAHVGAADPHPGYLTTAEGAASFDALGAAAAAQAASQPAAANLTSWAALAPAAKQDAHANLTTVAGLTSMTSLSALGNTDIVLARDAANILAMRNATTAQAFRLYNTYTDASNYERARFEWAANVLTIGTQKLGTGTQRQMVLSAGRVTIGNDTTGTNHWYFDTDNTRALRAVTDNAYDIGASGATRPRTGYFGTNVIAGGYIQSAANLILGATSDLLWNGSSKITSVSDGVIKLTDNAATAFTRMCLGGTTTSFPALGRSGNALQSQLGDGSDLCGFSAAAIITTGGGLASNSINRGTGLQLGSTNGIRWSSDTTYNGTADLFVLRDAANVLAQRNGTTAQAFRLYNTYTDASNYERFDITWSANQCILQMNKLGTGALRNVQIIGGSNLYLLTSAGGGLRIDASGNWIAITDATVDIGALGATRPRTGYFSSKVSCAYVADTGGTNRFDFSTANMVGLFGSSNAYPGLKRNSARLDIRLGDDTGYAALACGQPLVCGGNAIAAGGAVASAVLMSTTAAFGIYFGSGAPTVTAAKGSLYLRSDGSGVADRMYVNTDGGTTWTACATLA